MSEEAPPALIATSGAGVHEDVILHQGGSDPAPAPAFADLVPEAYKDKGWATEIKDVDQMFKMFDDQKVALSRRPAGIPGDTASADEQTAFNKAFGVPDASEGYQFAPTPEGLESNPEFQQKLGSMLHKAGVSQKQLAAMEPEWNAILQGMAGEGPTQEQQDAEFDKLADATFGTERERILAGSKALLDLHVPEALRQHMDEGSNGSLIAFAAALDSIRKEYISEDHIPDAGGSGATGATTEAAMRDIRMKIMKEEAFRGGPTHPGHADAAERMTAIRSRLDRFYESQSRRRR